MNTKYIRVFFTFASIVLALLGGYQLWRGYDSANDYNTYITQVRGPIEAQDVLLDEIQSQSAKGAIETAHSNDWLRRSQQIEEDLRQMDIEKDWLRDLHQYLLQRSQSITQMIAAQKRFLENGDDAILKEAEAHGKEAGNQLSQFIMARDALARQKNFEVKQ